MAVDLVNAYFRRWYPAGLDRQDPDAWHFRGGMVRSGWQYEGPGSEHRIFPMILCADGHLLSAQGHFGGYCYPCDDFSAEPYVQVEVLTDEGPEFIFEANGNEGHPCGDGFIYAFVPVRLVENVIALHGGIFDWNKAALG